MAEKQVKFADLPIVTIFKHGGSSSKLKKVEDHRHAWKNDQGNWTPHVVMWPTDGSGWDKELISEVVYPYGCYNNNNNTGGIREMNGSLYDGIVVKNKTVPAGEGVSTGVQISEVIYTKSSFAAPNDDVAKSIVLAEATPNPPRVYPTTKVETVGVKRRKWF